MGLEFILFMKIVEYSDKCKLSILNGKKFNTKKYFNSNFIFDSNLIIAYLNKMETAHKLWFILIRIK